MKIKHALQIVGLFLAWLLLALTARAETEQPPYEVQDTATAENFRSIYYGVDDVNRRMDEGVFDEITFATFTWSNQSRARAYASASISNHLSTTSAVISLDTEMFDDNNEYSTTTYRFTAASSGTYRVAGNVITPSLGAAGVRLIVAIFKNGSQYSRGVCHSGSTSDFGCSVQDIVTLGAGDYVELRAVQNAATAKDMTGGASNSSLSVMKEK